MDPGGSQESLAARLGGCGQTLPPELRTELLARGDAVVPELIELLANDELAMDGSPGDGWVPIHAADLLLDLRAEAAVPALLDALARSDWNETLHDRLADRLHELGPMVFEPAVALMGTLETADGRDAVSSVIAGLGVRDERIFGWCKELFDRDPVLGAMNFADYGDERALPLIRAAIEGFEPDWDTPFGLTDLRNLIDAYEQLSGELPDDLAELAAELQEIWEEHQAPGEEPEQPVVAAPKVGRNEPCPCGSGKKYKKCCGA